MAKSIDSQLNESLRDALVGYYMDEVIPNDPVLTRLQLNDSIKTTNDLYEYLLLDTQVSNDVLTSPVASAISSLQQYINGALLGMEPGHPTSPIDENEITAWRDQKSQYPIWAANQQLAIYPEIYIDPSLRLTKSAYFTQLEDNINQNKIHIDTTQEAVKNYLASFEEVANLTLINGYIDSTSFDSGTYYFIGKSTAEKVYYWRTVNMSERAYVAAGATEGAKVDHPNPGAWSDWQRADIAVNDNTVERTIRPVYFNNRLFVSWVDVLPLESKVNMGESTSLAEGDLPPPVSMTKRARLRFCLSYKKYDNTWSAPQTYIDYIAEGDMFGSLEKARAVIDTVASFDRNEASGSLFVALYSGLGYGEADDGSEDTYTLLRCLNIDKNFISSKSDVFPDEGKPESPLHYDSLRKTRLFALYNTINFQFPCPTPVIAIKSVETTPANSESSIWNFNDYQKKINDLHKDQGITYNHDTGKLTILSTTNSIFLPKEKPRITITYTFDSKTFIYCLMLDAEDENENEYMRAGDGSYALLESDGLYTAIGLRFDLAAPNSKDYLCRDFLRNSNGVGLFISPYMESGKRVGLSASISRDAYLYLKHITPTNADMLVYLGYAHFPNRVPAALNPISWSDQATSEKNTFRTGLGNPVLENLPYGSFSYRTNGASLTSLPPPATLEYQVPINPHTLLPDWNFSEDQTRGEFNITHGVTVFTDDNVVGNALKSTKIILHDPDKEGLLVAPKVNRKTDNTLGTVEFIDFTGSTIEKSDDKELVRQPIRMNTLFVRSLIERANVGLERLLSWETQLLEEPPMQDTGALEWMDFHGANSLYFWELFLHLPFLISHRLNLELQFDQAENWLGYIFDPSRKKNDYGRPDYWNVRALIPEHKESDHALRAPIDPDGIASSFPVHYQKAVYAHYIKNLIDRGDSAYRQLTPDSLSEARLWYARVQDLLGPRPDTHVVSQWTPMTLQALSDSTDPGLHQLELQMFENTLRQPAFTNGPGNPVSTLPTLRLSTYGSDPTVKDADNAFLLNPINSQLIAHWDTVESRIYNLGHNRTLDGKPLSLPLFAAPLDPRALLAAFASGANGASSARMLAQDIPHYRFAVMHSRANAGVETLIQFGTTLLSLIERKEQAELQELQHRQAWEYAQFAIDIQRQTQVIEQKSREALLASQAIAKGRLDYYAKLSDEVVSAGEISAGALHLAGRVSEMVAIVAKGVGAALELAPNHAGVSAVAVGGTTNGGGGGASGGGHRLEGALKIAEAVASGVAVLSHGAADAIDRTEGYRRRHQEWMLARDQAQLEIDQIDSQLSVLDEQNRLTAKLLFQDETALIQAKATYDFLGKRFTHSQLYQWLNSQYATFYYQAYDAVLSLCMAAQASWQYELCDYTTTFIKASAWSDAYRGLTAGESLKLNLIKMEAAYLSLNERRLEIIKTVSLRDLKKNTAQPEAPTMSDNISWDAMLLSLKDEGVVNFTLPVQLFDNDYPGQYQRRITRISVSLPAVIGPYQNIRALLTQTYSAVQIAEGSDYRLKENLRASQQIALSTGVDDDGMFQLRFDDERYLPFEGTGAISKWTLSFPNHLASVPSDEDGGQADQPMLRAIESLTDIIIRVSYTAKQGPIPDDARPLKSGKTTKNLPRRSV